MKLTSLLMGLTLALTPAFAHAQVATTDQDSCEEGTELNDEGDCVAAIILTDELGLPVGLDVTNFAPFVLPALAVAGAVVAAGAVNGDGGSANSTN